MLLTLALACHSPTQPSDVPVAEAPAETALPSVTGPFDPSAFTAEPLITLPLFGGTLTPVPVLGGAVAADPEGNRLVLVPASGVNRVVDLGENARPFRVAVSGTSAWVTLRGTGEVVGVELATQAVSWRTKVCAEPRGLEQAPDGTLVVACAGGALVGLDATTGSIVRSALLPSDLRDVVSADGILYVSRFRPGEVLLVDPATFGVLDVAPLGVVGRVAWRMRPLADGGVLVLYEEVSTASIAGPTNPAPNNVPEYYTSTIPCNALHQPAFATVGLSGTAITRAKLQNLVMTVDFAVLDDARVVVVNGGAGPQSLHRDFAEVGSLDEVLEEACLTDFVDFDLASPGQPSAIAEHDGTLWVATEGAARVYVSTNGTIPDVAWESGAPDAVGDDPFALFHQDAGTGIACASCHPEGQDDANLWRFANAMPGVAEAGLRRTMTLAGRLGERAPYHWMGELPDADALVHNTFTLGMGGREIATGQADDLVDWLDGLRPVRRDSAATAEALVLGEQVFVDRGCASCHAGPAYTTSDVAVVRPDSPAYKIPLLLGLGMRSAFLHDGCAPTLTNRFVGPESCTGGDLHGVVSDLDPTALASLVAWLETL